MSLQLFIHIVAGALRESVYAEAAPASDWLPTFCDAIPAHDPSTQTVVPNVPAIEQTRVRFTWQVVPLAQLVIDERADAAELEQLRQVYSALIAGTGTQAVRMARVERVCGWLIKQEAKRRGLSVS